MAQSSFPVAGQQFTDAQWRAIFGDEAGVVGDRDGSAYAITLPTDSDIVSVGSSTQESTAIVAGFAHQIPAGQPEGITIPAATAQRTDVIAVRYDPASVASTGPCSLVRIAGTSAAVPTFDDQPPGVEDLPLYAITRQPSQALSQATVKRLFPRIGRPLTLPAGATLPKNSPLGTTLDVGGKLYVRELNTQGVSVWNQRGLGTTGNLSAYGGWAARAGSDAPLSYHLSPDGNVTLRGVVGRTNASFATAAGTQYNIVHLPAAIAPSRLHPQISFAYFQGAHKPVIIRVGGASDLVAFESFAGQTGTIEQNDGYVSLNGITWRL